MLEDARILVAEDSPVVRDMLASLFRTKLGCKELFLAENGDEAMEIIQSSWPLDWVLSDWQMPGYSGEALLKEVRKRDSLTPFIMITARDDAQSIQKAVFSGVSDYVVKPFEVETLLLKIRTILEKGKNPA